MAPAVSLEKNGETANLKCQFGERGSSGVECRTHNRESPGSNPPFATVSKLGHFCSLH